MKKLLSVLLCAILLCSLALPVRAADERAEEMLDGIRDWNFAKCGASDLQQWIDTGLTETAGVGAEWYVMGLVKSGEEYNTDSYAAALQEYVDTHKVTSAATRQKLALAFLACGVHSDFVDATARDSVGELGVMSWIFGLHLSNCGVETSYSSEEIIDELLSLRFEDGGWAVSGERGDPDATSMAIQALAPHCGEPRVKEAVDKAVDFLSRKQLSYGGYASFGMECPDSIAQVVIALSVLGIDPFTDERFIKDGHNMLDAFELYRVEDGSFAHGQGEKTNALSTVETYYALCAYLCQQRGEDSIFLFDAPTREIGDVIEAVNAAKAPRLSTRLLLCIGVGALALIACIVLFIKGRRHWKNFLFVLLAAAAGIYAVCTVQLEKTDDYYGAVKHSGETIKTTITIRCDVVAGRAEHIPADGMILKTTEIEVPAGSTAFDQLVLACREYRIHMDKEESGISSAYIRGLANLYEFDYGDLSGWMFCVGEKYAGVGCGEYELSEGDNVEWRYTLELGKDIGDDWTGEDAS